MREDRRDRIFLRLNSITLIAVFFLIFIGGVVRSTGSGMGCPDWPKCFGQLIPPTDVSELPQDYQEIYSKKRQEKNTRLSSVLSMIGLERLAIQIITDESILEEEPFNPVKTWVEYLNRLLGVVVGLLITGCLIGSIGYLKDKKRIFFLSLGALILVGFIGWVGSIVVSTNLLPGMITFHMILAIGLIALLIYIRFTTKKETIKGLITDKPYKVKRLLLACLLLFVAQVVLGTQVREAVDIVADKFGEENKWDWINHLGLTFYIHRSYSLIILGLHIFLLYRLLNSVHEFHSSKVLVWALMIFVVLEVLAGAALAYFAFPFLVQPLHLLLAVLIFGVQYYLYLIMKERTKLEMDGSYAT